MLDKLAAVSKKLSPGLRQVVSNISWLFVDKILQMGMGLLVGVWVARYLGPDKFGLLNYAIAFASLFSPLATLGLDGIVVRDLARAPASKEETLGTTFTLKLTGGILTVFLSVGTIYLSDNKNLLTVILVAIISAGTIFQAFDTIVLWFRSQLEAKYTVIAKRTVYICISLVKIALILIQADIIAFAIVISAETAFGALGLVIAYQKRGHKIQLWRANLNRAKELLADSWPLLLSGLTAYIYSKIDQVMLGSLLDNKSELAFYSVAVRLSEIFDFLPMMLNTSVLPKLTEIKQKSQKDYQDKFQIYFDVMLLLWLAITIPISLGASWIVNIMYGPAYAPSGGILTIYVWAQIGSYLGLARSAFLLIEGKQKWSLFFSVTGATMNIIINWLLIPRYGAMGATIATLITYYSVTLVINFFVPDLKPVGGWILNSLNLYKACMRVRGLVR